METLLAGAGSFPTVGIKKIVAAVDLSPESKETTYFAGAFAKALGASLVLVHVLLVDPLYHLTNVFEEEHRRRAEGLLAALRADLKKRSVPCESRVLLGDPAEEIANLAREVGADLLITGARRPSPIAQWFKIDRPPQIMLSAPCSVLVYRSK
jgi:nucleotide-binding universal stress UspA family protein